MAQPNIKIRKKKPHSRTNKKIFITLSFLICTVFASIIFIQYQLYSDGSSLAGDDELDVLDYDLETAIKPFTGQSFPLTGTVSDSPFWGSLNSGHYFSLKLARPESIETSFLWFGNELNNDGRLSMRHLCDQNDNLDYYSWTRHDFFSFGEQTIKDKDYILTTSYLKNPDNELEWKAKINVNYSDTATKSDLISLIYYVTTDYKDDSLKILSNHRKSNEKLVDSDLLLEGISKDIGQFQMQFRFNSSSDNLIYAIPLATKIDKSKIPVSTFLHSRMVSRSYKGDRIFVLSSNQDNVKKEDINIIAYQVVIKAPGVLEIDFRTGSDHKFHESYQIDIDRKFLEFDRKFRQIFPMTELDEKNSSHIDQLGKVALSNMIGSIGYFFGSSYIGSGPMSNKIATYGPIQLLTGVPSRSFFPRGFLWDEGFHNLLISEWNPNISNMIIKSWFEIMNINGWIPREVILGVESMRRVPYEFIIQHITNANPPAMLLVIDRMLDKNTLNKSTLESIYPRLKKWYRWFNVTQKGLKPGTFRWRGRDEFSVSMLNPKTLTSGLDDYPRASHPSPEEYHIDIRCWMARSALILSRLSEKMKDTEYHIQITADAKELMDSRLLDDLHWSNEHGMYCDFGHNTEKAELVLVTKTRQSKHSNTLETYQVLERHSTGHPNFGCVPEFGYVSLFPLMLNILDHRSEKLGIILNRLRDENELWSPYGIRSLSKSSRYYNKYNTEHDKPYWRGAVWLNLNYLILSSLKSYSTLDGPYKERCARLFTELRSNLVDNVLREFSRTNYMWENYDDQTGHGKGSHPFTGWTSLILLIMSSNLN